MAENLCKVESPDQVLYDNRGELRSAREDGDAKIIALIDGIDPAKLDRDLRYTTMEGEKRRTGLSLILTNVFNHQTHHRSQVHALLSQAGQDPPSLDMIAFVHPA